MKNEYYTLGRTGLRVSRLSLGTMTFGTEWGWGADKEAARAIFNAYADAGGNFYDTADLYTNGVSETWLGEFVADRGLRDKAVIATKFTFNAEPGNPNAGGNGRKNILRAVEGSLKRLQTDYIDLYIMHTWDRITPAEEVMRTLDDLVAAGKIRHVGLSDVPGWYAGRAQTLAELRGWEPVSSLQLEYSLVERNLEHEYVPFGAAANVGITAWSPLGSGLLSGKYKPGEQGAGRLETMRAAGNAAFDKFTERNWRIVAELETVAKEAGHSMAAVALNWVTHRPGIASTIIGATSLEQLEANLAAVDFTLDPALAARLDEVSKPEIRFPYNFYQPPIQDRVSGGTAMGDKPVGYRLSVRTEASA